MTNFTSNVHNLSSQDLENFYVDIPGWDVDSLILLYIQLSFSGHGHYTATAGFWVNDQKIEVNRTISYMPLVDAWKSGMRDDYENGEDTYDDWEEVVTAMLTSINAEDAIYDAAYTEKED